MPDIDFQRIELNLIPKKGDEPVIFYASQYESARPFIADLKWGTTEFAPGDDCYAEIDIRKNDNNLVVITDDVAIDNNEVSVILPVQALTCIGKNLGQVKIYAADEQLIAALNFILEVQPDPLAGGVDSETAIDNLESQIAAIVPEVIGEDYYDKTEVDNLLADKADVSDLPDMTQYYTKTQTDTLLNTKADASTTYTKTEVDNALALKANSSDLATVATTGDYDDLINKPTIPAAQIQSDYAQADNTKVDYIKNKPDINGMIAAAIFDILPVGTASGNPCSFDTEISGPLQGLSAEIIASGGGGTPDNPIPIVGYSDVNLTRCGVNLCSSLFTDGYVPSISDGSLVLEGGSRTDFIPVKPSTLYTFLIDDAAQMIYMFFYDENKTYISYTAAPDSTHTSFTATTPANCKYIMLRTQSSYVERGILAEGTHTQYIPYNGQTITLSLGQTVYGGRLYFENGWKCEVTHERIDLGTKNWNAAATNTPNVYRMTTILANKPTPNTQPFDAICEVYSAVSANETYICNKGISGSLGGTDIFVYDDNYNTSTSAADFKTAMSGKYLVYPLVTPFTIDLSSSDMLDAVVGQNNISSNGNGDVTAQYKDSIQHYIDNQ